MKDIKTSSGSLSSSAKTPVSKPTAAKTDNPGSMFIVMALDMSWRLALTVLIPLVGGFELDKALNTQPYLTILGTLAAIAGVGLIMRRTLKVANLQTADSGKSEKHA